MLLTKKINNRYTNRFSSNELILDSKSSFNSGNCMKKEINIFVKL